MLCNIVYKIITDFFLINQEFSLLVGSRTLTVISTAE